jgi:VWFA-related protein
MVKWLTLLVFLGGAAPALATRSISVAQLELLLAANKGKSDGHLAQRLSEVELTERVSPAQLAQWEKTVVGNKSREELTLLADRAAFLKVPAEDLITDSAPNGEIQTRLFHQAVENFGAALGRLPNFFAKRETIHFEDAPGAELEMTNARALPGHGGGSPLGMSMETSEAKPLHAAGTYSATVTYRDGAEVQDAVSKESKNKASSPVGLTTSGEFGPMLGAVLADTDHGQVTWDHWERGASGPVAVFRYSVPEDRSNWTVGVPNRAKLEKVQPAYHGEIEIDTSGNILRLSAVADLAPPHQMIENAILVEYAPITLGNSTYICPVHGVAYSKVPVDGAAHGVANSPAIAQTQLNDVSFTQYHLFRADARIVPNDSARNDTDAAHSGIMPSTDSTAVTAPKGTPASSADVVSMPSAAPEIPAAPQPALASASPVEATATRAPNPTPALPSEAAAPRPAESASAVDVKTIDTTFGAPASARPSPGEMSTESVFHSRSNLVLVDLGVTDHDRPVRGLDRSRFHAFDNERERPIASFEEGESAPIAEVAYLPTLPPNTYTNAPVSLETHTVNVFLLDLLNTSASGYEQLRKQVIAFLRTAKPGTPLAIFSLSSRLRMIGGFTTDAASLAPAVRDQKSNERASAGLGLGSDASMSTSQFQGAIAIANNTRSGNDAHMQSQLQSELDASNAVQRTRITLDALGQLARYLAAIPGRKNLIWFSGSFPVGLWLNATERAPVGIPRDDREAVQRTDGLLAAARVAVYPVDLGGLRKTSIADASDLGSNTLPNIFGDTASQEQGAMNTIAMETGGRAYTNSNDLKEVAERIIASGSSYYTLTYVPPSEARAGQGGEFHRIGVKVTGGKYQLAYRSGYYAEGGSGFASGANGTTSAIAAAAAPGSPPSTQILFRVRVLPEGDPQIQGPIPAEVSGMEKPAGSPSGWRRFVVDLNVNLQDLTFVQEAGGGRRAQLEYVLVAYDSAGKALKSLGRRFDLDLGAQQPERSQTAQKSVPLRLMVDLPAGAVLLRNVVYDPADARTGSLELPIQSSGLLSK